MIFALGELIAGTCFLSPRAEFLEVLLSALKKDELHAGSEGSGFPPEQSTLIANGSLLLSRSQ